MTDSMRTPAANHRYSGKQKCFLCEIPRSPWAMLFNFAEPICRACCNYEGIDKIAEVIEKAKKMRVVEGYQQPKPKPKQQQSSMKNSHPHSSLSTEATCSRPIGQTMAGDTEDAPQAVGVLPSDLSAEHTLRSAHDSTTERFAQIQETLNTLSKSTPFRVRFCRDHSLIGRVIAFDAVCRGSDYELKTLIEYPLGSQTVFLSASGASSQMCGEYREQKGREFRSSSSNGYKDLEFERVHGDKEWKVLGELLTREVRFFLGFVQKDLLPTPYLDPKFPNLPPATLNATRSFLHKNPLRKRHISGEGNNDGSEARKERRVDDSASSSLLKLKSPSQNSPGSNGYAYNPTQSPVDGWTSLLSMNSPSSVQSNTPMKCPLCHCTLLKDARFVQRSDILAKNQQHTGAIHTFQELLCNLHELVQSLAHNVGLRNHTCQELQSTQQGGGDSNLLHPTKTPSLKNALKGLYPIAAEWKNLGIMLGIEKSTLDMITKETSNPRDCLREMLSVWLKSVDPPPTWSMLTGAVEDIGERQLAASLKSFYS